MTEQDRRDERIAAYLDGAMDSTEAAAFEAELAGDPLLAAELAEWRANDVLLREAYAGPVEAGVDDRLLHRMGLAQAPSPSAANDNPAGRRRWRWPAGVATAAALALALLLRPPAASTGADLQALEQLAALDTARTGGASITPVLTARAADGRWCREFVRSGGAAPGRGIACRGASGWTLEAFAPGEESAPDDNRIVPASGPQAQALDRAYARLDTDDPLDPAQEKVAMARGWR